MSLFGSFWVLAVRGWQALSGLATLYFVSTKLSLVEQGSYYALLTLVGAVSLFDLGLVTFLVTLLAARADKGGGYFYNTVLANRVAKVYFLLGGLVLFLWGPLGCVYLLSSNAAELISLWWCLVVCTGFLVVLMPYFFFVEALQSFVAAYQLRLIVVCTYSLVLWLGLYLGVGLWALAWAQAFSVLVSLLVLLFMRPLLARVWRTRRERVNFSWRKQVWPLQWRAGVSFIGGYVVTQLNTLWLYALVSKDSAARYGLSLTIINMLALLAGSVIAKKIPVFARLAHLKDVGILSKTLRQTLWLVSALYFGLAALVCGVAFGLLQDVLRVLAWPGFLALLLYGWANVIFSAFIAYGRAFGKEPFFRLSLASMALSIVVINVAMRYFGVDGVVFSLAFIYCCVITPWLFNSWRRGEIGRC